MLQQLLVFFLLFGSMLGFASSSLIVMRHGEGEHNVQRVFSSLTKEEGGVDHSLTAKGREEVQATAERLLQLGFNRETVARVVVSPLQRTKETAQILADCGVCSQEVMVIDPRIREHLVNQLEGVAREAIAELSQSFSCWQDELRVLVQKGSAETDAEIRARVESILLSVREQNQGHVLFVTHGAIASIILDLYGENSNINTAEAKILPLLDCDRLSCVNLEGHHSDPSSDDPSSAVLRQYGPPCDHPNLGHSETLQNPHNLTGRSL